MFFWNSVAFSMIQRMLAIWSLVPLPFLKPAWTSGSCKEDVGVGRGEGRDPQMRCGVHRAGNSVWGFVVTQTRKQGFQAHPGLMRHALNLCVCHWTRFTLRWWNHSRRCAGISLLGFPDISVGKEFSCYAGDPGLIPGSGRSAGDLPDPGYLLQYSGLEYFSRLLTYF